MKTTSFSYKIASKLDKITLFDSIIFSILLLLLYIIITILETLIRLSAWVIIVIPACIGVCVLSVLYVMASLTAFDIIILSIDADDYIERRINYLERFIKKYWRVLGL